MGILNKRKLSLCDKKGQIIKRFILKDNNLKNDIIKKKKESDVIEMNGIVEECLANTNFVVSIQNGEKFLCFISGKLRVNKVKINLGDTVKIQIHKLNFEQRRGKIVYRYLQQTPIKRKSVTPPHAAYLTIFSPFYEQQIIFEVYIKVIEIKVN
ncbi:translation initiation factor IF-1, putative [Plasmodium vinckei]|uniref:Translation initiation factor IF-1, putative n=1 Tax=Plasmodium vinckei TaxID=5860 RepID=A0A6V7TBM0_PLAVN|nr:translation initiation factor IF-1, putative [Plasmodium vinckei]